MSEYENKITRVNFAMSKEKDNQTIHALNIISAKHGGVSKSVRKSINSMYEWAFVPTMYIAWSKEMELQTENFLKACAAANLIHFIRSVTVEKDSLVVDAYEGCIDEYYEGLATLARFTVKRMVLNKHKFDSDFYLLD